MLGKQEFEDIVLTKLELNELKRFNKGKVLQHCDFNVLLEHGLIEGCADIITRDGMPVSSGGYNITEKGIRYLEYRWMFGWRGFVKYLADNWIAVLSLAVSIVSLIVAIAG